MRETCTIYHVSFYALEVWSLLGNMRIFMDKVEMGVNDRSADGFLKPPHFPFVTPFYGSQAFFYFYKPLALSFTDFFLQLFPPTMAA